MTSENISKDRRSDAPLKKKPGPEDFIFGKLIGEGSYSSVYLAKEVKTGNEYAIKVLEKRHITREKKVEYVRRERDVFAMIGKHPYFVNLYCTFQDEDRLFFVLSYARRGELLDYIKKLGCFDENCTRFYVAEIVLALEHLKSLDIIHRDMKPENILLNDEMHIQITDFGSAKIMGKNPITPTVNGQESSNIKQKKNSFVGTAQYVSPEVLKSKQTHYSTDLWALGCIIYQLLSGKLPFWGGHEYQIFQKIIALDYSFPEGFNPVARDLVEKLLVIEPMERLGSEAKGGFDALKAHPFFEGIDWKDLDKQDPPEILPYLPAVGTETQPMWSNKMPGFGPEVIIPGFNEPEMKSSSPEDAPFLRLSDEERKRRLDDQTKNNKYHRFIEGNLVIKQALIEKRKGLFARCRMFLLTEGPHLYYVDPQHMVLKGEIPWSKDLRPEPKNFKIFFVHTPNRTYYLEDKQGNALIWCKEIDNVYRHYYGERKTNESNSSS